MKIEITLELLVDLKEKAEKALKDDVVAFIPTDDSYKNQALYVNAANPAVMLALIAKIEQLEKEADYLSLSLSKRGGSLDPFCCPENVPYKPIMDCVAEHGECAVCWRNAAKEAVKVNE